MDNKDTGLLLKKNYGIELQRKYFKQMLQLRGINILHREPKESSINYTINGELDTFYNAPIQTTCIFEEHPKQQTMKKLGWLAEFNGSTSLIQVPYDLNVQVGSLFIIPSGLDNAEPRTFKVLRMTSIAVFPAYITCEVGPLWNSNISNNMKNDFVNSNFNYINEEDN